MLSYEQVMFFNAFGYLHLRERFTKDEMATIRREAEEIWYEQVPGFDGKEFVNLSPFAERRPFLSQLVDDDRLYDIPEGILGADFLFQVTEGCVRVGDTPWHGGGHTQSPLPHIKVSVYLDSLDRNNGCLRVLPGSHRNYLNLIDKRWAEAPDPLQPLRRRNTDPGYMAFVVAPSDLPGVALESQSGDVIVHTEDVLHASFGGGDRRYQLTWNFFGNPESERQIEYVKEWYASGNTRSLRPAESWVSSDRPRIRRMASRLVELGFETTDL